MVIYRPGIISSVSAVTYLTTKANLPCALKIQTQLIGSITTGKAGAHLSVLITRL